MKALDYHDTTKTFVGGIHATPHSLDFANMPPPFQDLFRRGAQATTDGMDGLLRSGACRAGGRGDAPRRRKGSKPE